MFESWQAQVYYIDQDVQSCNYDWIVKRFERSQEKNYKWVQLLFQLFLHFNSRQGFLLMLITNQNQTLLL